MKLQNRFVILILSFSILFAGSLSGCQTCKKYPENLFKHRSPMVKYPSRTGMVLGAIAGLPIEILYLPFGLNVDTDGNEGDAWFYALLPMEITGVIGETALGGPCWMLFGWWWPETKAEQPKLPEEIKTDQPRPGTNEKDTNPKSP